MRLTFALLLVCATGCAPRLYRVATHDARVTDPEYTGVYRLLGERELAERRYPEAWYEYAALGEFSGLRRVIFAHAADVTHFDAGLYDQMLVEYARGYARQHETNQPLSALEERIAALSDEHLATGDSRRLRIAWALRYHLIARMPLHDDRARLFPQLLALHAALAGSPDADTQAFASTCFAEIEQLRTDAMGRL